MMSLKKMQADWNFPKMKIKCYTNSLLHLHKFFSHIRVPYIITTVLQIKYSSADHHQQKNQKTTSQIKFSAVTIKKTYKTSLNDILYVNKC